MSRGQGRAGGNGLGGGIDNDGSSVVGVSSLSVTGSSITYNVADGGEECLPPEMTAKASEAASISVPAESYVSTPRPSSRKKPPASTSNDNVFGVYTTC